MAKLHVAPSTNHDNNHEDNDLYDAFDGYQDWLRSMDKYGHSHQCRVNYPSYLTAAAEAILSSGLFDYRSVADIFRVGFNRELRVCNDMMKDPTIELILTMEKEECRQQNIEAKEAKEVDFLQSRRQAWEEMDRNRSPYLLEAVSLARHQLQALSSKSRRKELLDLIHQYEDRARLYA